MLGWLGIARLGLVQLALGSVVVLTTATMNRVMVVELAMPAILPGLLLSGLYFLWIMTVATVKPSMAPSMEVGELDMKPSGRKNIWLFLGILVVSIFAAVEAEVLHIHDDVNWPLISFLTIFVAAMWIGKKEGNTLLGGILKGFVPPIFLIVMVLGSIFAGWATPTEAAGVGAFGSLLLAWINGTLNFDVLRQVTHRTALTVAMIFFIFVGATAFSTIFRNVYGEDLIIEFIEHLNLGPWALLFMLMGTIFLMGFFFDFLEITLIILPVFDPVIRTIAPAFAPHLGLEDPTNQAALEFVQTQVIYWFAILVAVNLQTSFLTPPFGFALFYMKGVAPSSVKMQEIYKGIIPFVTLQVIGMLVVLSFPRLALQLPYEAGLARIPWGVEWNLAASEAERRKVDVLERFTESLERSTSMNKKQIEAVLEPLEDQYLGSDSVDHLGLMELTAEKTKELREQFPKAE